MFRIGNLYFLTVTEATLQRIIPTGLSLYLDLARFLAAIVVVMHHTWPLIFPTFPLPWPGHSAVVVFFVLSGYVIAHASRPDLGLRAYAQHRMARILPVAFAALILSFLISPFVGTKPVQYGGAMVFSWENIALNALFIAQSWMDVSPPFNPPFWSLNYEVWYYIIFGAWVYLPNRIYSIIAALIAGPKIFLLFPVWLLGVFLYKWMPVLDSQRAMRIFIASFIIAFFFFWFDVSVHIREAMKIIWPVAMGFTHGSGMFVGDFLLGLLVATNFIAAASLNMKPLFHFEASIRYLSSFTFSIYVFHMPLSILIWNGLKYQMPIVFYSILALFIFGFGQATERRTKFYRSLFQLHKPASLRSAES